MTYHYLLLWGPGHSFPGDARPVMTDTTDALYADRWGCVVEAIRAEGAFAHITSHDLDEAGHLFDPDSGLMVEYGRTFDRPPYHAWCPTCGVLVDHGDGQDSEHFTCNDAGCDAPECIEPERSSA